MKYKVGFKGLAFSLGYFVFWIIVSWIDRSIFIIDNLADMTDNGIGEVLMAFIYGLKMDISMAAYICALPAVVYFGYNLVSGKRLSLMPLKIYTTIVVAIYAIISIINLGIYREWNLKVSKRAIDAFFETPKEVMASANDSPWFIGLMIFLFYFIIFLYGWKFLIKKCYQGFCECRWDVRAIRFLIVVFVLFTAIRGGYGRATLNPSVAYHSTNSINNHAAVNTHWAFMKEMISRRETKNPYQIFDQSVAESKINPLFDIQGNYPVFLTNKNANVVLVILESFVADLISSLGGEEGITPGMESLIREGVLFDQIYAASDRSDKGIISIFSGFPSQGNESIIKYISKHEKLPSLTQVFDSLAYETTFYYGGQSEFYNFKSFMLAHEVDEVIDQRSFKPWEVKSSWGVYDDLVFNRLLQDLNKKQQPFFSSIFTISNHEPFDLEGTYKFGKEKLEDRFQSTAYYTDSVLYDFIEKAKDTEWYPNTLFVMVADHGHRLPAGWKLNESKRYHIPLLFYGDVIKPEYRGKRVSKIGNQSDLVAILLGQMGIENSRFPWSRNILSEDYKEYAFYTTKGVVGVKTPEQEIGYDYDGKIVTRIADKNISEEKNKLLLDTAVSYYQCVFEQFLKY